MDKQEYARQAYELARATEELRIKYSEITTLKRYIADAEKEGKLDARKGGKS